MDQSEEAINSRGSFTEKSDLVAAFFLMSMTKRGNDYNVQMKFQPIIDPTNPLTPTNRWKWIILQTDENGVSSGPGRHTCVYWQRAVNSVQ